MWTFFQDKILCPLNIGVPKEKFHCIRCFSKYCNKWWGYSEVATHWPPQLWWQHQISLCQLLWAHNGTFSKHEMSVDRFLHKNRCNIFPPYKWQRILWAPWCTAELWHSLNSFIKKYCFHQSKIEFISSCCCVISSIIINNIKFCLFEKGIQISQWSNGQEGNNP